MPSRLAFVLAFFFATTPVWADYPDQCLGPVEPSAESCPPGLTYTGCCDESGRAVYCKMGKLLCLDCAGISPTCGWTPGKSYNCGTDGGADPSGIFPPTCKLCEPQCGQGESCKMGQCAPCQPDCAGQKCGFDGCGGSCGICAEGQWCDGKGQCQDAPQCPAPVDLKCGTTVSATTLGTKNTLDNYSCTGADSGGGERAYRFSNPTHGMVRFELKGGEGVWLRMYLTHSQCTPAACFAEAHELLEVSLQGGIEYFVIIDGHTDSEGEFELTVTCQATCLPNCTNSECGTDGCFGSCGECDAPAECYKGQCFANDGCAPTYLKGCGGCVCEECVCAADSWCCGVAWDEACVNRCDVECGGCGIADYCSDGECSAPAEDCGTCPNDQDIAVPAPHVDIILDIPAVDVGPQPTDNKSSDDSGCCDGGAGGPLGFFLSVGFSLLFGWVFARRRLH